MCCLVLFWKPKFKIILQFMSGLHNIFGLYDNMTGLLG